MRPKADKINMSIDYDAKSNISISTVVFDYGGVLAEEGFREGLLAIARKCGLEPQTFFESATETIYQTGYLTGRASEERYWDTLRKLTGIALSDESMKNEIIRRFILRTPMIHLVRLLRGKKLRLAILSDQTNWLDELNERDHFFQEFDLILNSYKLGKGKRDKSIFEDLVTTLGESPPSIVFVDDNEGHTGRAKSLGIQAVTFSNIPDLLNTFTAMKLITASDASAILPQDCAASNMSKS